jgi:hypothetical protein
VNRVVSDCSRAGRATRRRRPLFCRHVRKACSPPTLSASISHTYSSRGASRTVKPTMLRRVEMAGRCRHDLDALFRAPTASARTLRWTARGLATDASPEPKLNAPNPKHGIRISTMLYMLVGSGAVLTAYGLYVLFYIGYPASPQTREIQGMRCTRCLRCGLPSCARTSARPSKRSTSPTTAFPPSTSKSAPSHPRRPTPDLRRNTGHTTRRCCSISRSSARSRT